MSRRIVRPSVIAAAVLCGVTLSACASAGSRSGSYTRLIVSGEQIRQDGYATAYEALTHHRELVIFEDRIAFEGGDDRSGRGRDALTYTVPMLVVNGNFNLNDAITTLRGIRASDVVQIRLYYASMVPPEYRRPGAEGGVIEVITI
ncbi:MAG: hypothetical protein OEU54_04825 [Gemmatimonadota bacterium]|nr:hypothetical protein [Gemmatimonadota bacterium]